MLTHKINMRNETQVGDIIMIRNNNITYPNMNEIPIKDSLFISEKIQQAKRISII